LQTVQKRSRHLEDLPGKTLFPDHVLQEHSCKEGFNISGDGEDSNARIGFVAANKHNCQSPDSYMVLVVRRLLLTLSRVIVLIPKMALLLFLSASYLSSNLVPIQHSSIYELFYKHFWTCLSY
jgi:hypothetical protein